MQANQTKMTENVDDKKKGWTSEELKKFVEEDLKIETILPELQKKLNLKKELFLSKTKFEGLNNHNKLLETEDQKFFLRIKSKEKNNSYSTPEREFKVLKLFEENDLNISPKVYYFDSSCELIPFPFSIMEYIEGEVSSKVDFRLVAKCLKKLHSIDISSLKGENANILEIGEELAVSDEKLIPIYFQVIEDWILKTGKEIFDEEKAKKLEDLYAEIINISSKYLHLRKKLSRTTIIHRDVHDLNLILPAGKKELMLLDWEMVHLNHFLVDICYYTVNLTDEEEKEFFEIYGYDTNEDKMIVWLQYMEQLLCNVAFYINIYKVAKADNLTLPIVGDQFQIEKKLKFYMEKLERKFKTFE
jgi:aminoglycoside phosphotransferase (APT) family kinase protein